MLNPNNPRLQLILDLQGEPAQQGSLAMPAEQEEEEF